MKKIIILCLLLVSSVITHAEMKIGDSTTIIFAPVEMGQKILTTNDDYIQRLSQFDRSAKMKSDKEITEEEFLKHLSSNVIAWDESEQQLLDSIFTSVKVELDTYASLFPEKIYLIKTTGEEEGGAEYTRSNGIVFAQNTLTAEPDMLKRILCHELFHVLTRKNPQLQEKLFAMIGFYPCNEIIFPDELINRKITNPDAPKNNHWIELDVNGKKIKTIPILFSTIEKYDTQLGGEFFEYMDLQFLELETGDDSTTLKAKTLDGSAKFVDMSQATGFFEQIGYNTNYILHPEEILAENFAMLILQPSEIPSPELIDSMRKVLANKM